MARLYIASPACHTLPILHKQKTIFIKTLSKKDSNQCVIWASVPKRQGKLRYPVDR
ncbi:hypothetical protein [Coleofasciculus chthonoplastes]|uniref:hypothetical protein n=1 Tax=Coleofasciculus chthonoplastes TaxID=64178 RepID=UPI0012F95DC0|nr:hypothetical protein [Coleofasciculus chthonoplastes]